MDTDRLFDPRKKMIRQNQANSSSAVVSITYEEIGLFPRSFNRVFDRFVKQVFSDVENLVIQEYRFYRYLFLTTLKCLFFLLFIPFLVNFIAKQSLVEPLTEYFWNTKQTEIFLNSYQQKKAFSEFQDFEEKLYFESLINSEVENKDIEKKRSNFKNPEIMTKTVPLPCLVETRWNSVPSEQKEKQKILRESNPIQSPFVLPTLSLRDKAKAKIELGLIVGNSKEFGNGLYKTNILERKAMPVHRTNIVGSTSSQKLVVQELQVSSNPEAFNGSIEKKLHESSKSPKNIIFSTEPTTSKSLETLYKCQNQQRTCRDERFIELTKKDKELFTESRVYPISYKNISMEKNSGFVVKESRGLGAEIQRSSVQRPGIRSTLEERLQQKTVELAIRYNTQSIEAITNFFADLLSLMTLCFLFFVLEIQINITKSFLLEVFFGLDDSKKSLIILLITDLLVGYHSSNLWELFFQFCFNHYGFPENQTGIFLLVATFPVLLDVLFKYLIFRHLNRASPATVATYHAMIE